MPLQAEAAEPPGKAAARAAINGALSTSIGVRPDSRTWSARAPRALLVDPPHGGARSQSLSNVFLRQSGADTRSQPGGIGLAPCRVSTKLSATRSG
jgi:hypothetical protein